jgi:hypothetical protein
MWLVSAALADWPDQTLLAAPAGDEVLFAAAVRQWPSSGDVFVALEWADTVSLTSRMELRWHRCDPPACAAPALLSAVGVGQPGSIEESLHASLSVDATHAAPGEVPLLVALRQDADEDCDGDGVLDPAGETALDVVAYRWSTADGLGAEPSIVASGCDDRGLQRTERVGSEWLSCFTTRRDTGDLLSCAGAASPQQGWTAPVDLAGAPEDHPSLAVHGGERVIAGSLRPAGQANDQIRIHFPDRVPEGAVDLPTDGDGPAYPDLWVWADGALNVVYEADERDAVRLASCPAGSDCADPSQWLTEEVLTSATGNVAHPQVAVDGALELLVFQQDVDPTAGETWRVYATARCGDGPWWPAEVVRTPAADEDQSVAVGHPHLALDRVHGLAHLVLVEGGSAWWARRPYVGCPAGR